MSKLYIDTEFNGFQGELISMALVPWEGPEFYEVLECKNPVPWVAENVMPHLGKQAITKKEFQNKLQDFLMQQIEISIVADWPEDIQHFCQALITGPGFMMNTPDYRLEFIINRRLNSSNSKIPHNALEDARAIRDAVYTPKDEGGGR